MAVRISLEIGHEASIRNKRTQEGFTHDWEVFVRGCEGAEIHYYIEKVVFYLHETFPKPKRVIKEPPYSVKESGYAGFNLPIDIYLRNNVEPKKVRFNYDLHLQPDGPPILKVRKEKYVFSSPTDEFKMKLLKGGGVIVSASNIQEINDRSSLLDEKTQLISKPKLGGSGDLLKKQRMKPEEPVKNNFQELFGSPIITSSRAAVEQKQPLWKDPNKNVSKSEKSGDKTKTKHSPHKDGHKDKDKDKSKDKTDSDKKSSKEEKKQRDKQKERERSRDKSIKKDKSPRPKSPSPKRIASPKRISSPSRLSSPPVVKHKEPKQHDKEKREKSEDKKAKKEKRKEHKESKHAEEQRSDEHKEMNKSAKTDTKKDAGKVVVKESTSSPSPKPADKKDKSKEKSKEPPKEERSNNDKSHSDKYRPKKRDKEKRDKKEEKPYKPEKKSAMDSKPPNHYIPPPKQEPEPSTPKKEKTYITPAIVEENSSDSSSSSSSSSRASPERYVDKKSVKKSTDVNTPVPISTPVKMKEERNTKSKKDRNYQQDSSAIKCKRKSESPNTDELPPKVAKEQNHNNNSDGDQEAAAGKTCLGRTPEELMLQDESYLNILRDLQQKIMDLTDNEDLQKVVQLIAETGRYEVSAHTFDFDLCLLDRATVQQLQDFFANDS